MGLVSITRLRHCVLWIGLCLSGSPLWAQAVAPPVDPLANSALPAPHLSKDRTNLQRFQAVAKAVDAVDASTGDLVRLLLELPEDRWYGNGSQGRGMRRELVEQLNRLPADLRDRFAKDIALRVDVDLQQAIRRRDVQGLLQIAGRYPGTATSQLALRSAAMIAWDRADFSTAAMIAVQTLPVPSEARREHLPIILQAAAARHRAGEPDRARELLEQYATVFGETTLPETSLRISTALASFESLGTSSEIVFNTKWIYPAVVPRWKVPVLNDSSWNDLFDLESQSQRNSGFHSLPAAVPCVTANRLLLRTYASLQAYDLQSGKPAWDCAALAEIADPERDRRSIDNPGFRDF